MKLQPSLSSANNVVLLDAPAVYCTISALQSTLPVASACCRCRASGRTLSTEYSISLLLETERMHFLWCFYASPAMAPCTFIRQQVWPSPPCRRDTQAQKKSIARITREEKLSNLRIELSNGKVVSVGQMRGIRRLLIIAGSEKHITEALQQAEPLKQELVDRGVLVVPLYKDGAAPVKSSQAVQAAEALVASSSRSSSSGQQSGQSTVVVDPDVIKRFIAAPIYTSEWNT